MISERSQQNFDRFEGRFRDITENIRNSIENTNKSKYQGKKNIKIIGHFLLLQIYK